MKQKFEIGSIIQDEPNIIRVIYKIETPYNNKKEFCQLTFNLDSTLYPNFKGIRSDFGNYLYEEKNIILAKLNCKTLKLVLENRHFPKELIPQLHKFNTVL